MQVHNGLQHNHIWEVRHLVVCAVTAFCHYCSHADDLIILQVCLCYNNIMLIGMLCSTEILLCCLLQTTAPNCVWVPYWCNGQLQMLHLGMVHSSTYCFHTVPCCSPLHCRLVNVACRHRLVPGGAPGTMLLLPQQTPAADKPPWHHRVSIRRHKWHSE